MTISQIEGIGGRGGRDRWFGADLRLKWPMNGRRDDCGRR